MTPEDWAKLIEQLGYLPGGAASAEPEYFGSLVQDELAPLSSEWDYEGWLLKDGSLLTLRLHEGVEGMRLYHVTPEDELAIAHAGKELLDAARTGDVSPLLLMLLAIATGQVDDRNRLKRVAPKVDAAAKDLMLMSVCRLCG
jgi:hypothetical protein